ncbi:MAG: hypothetical protein FWE50_01405 [Alphaproteobacteria bacterium]|nr:hypothetical protein [Alphaproteobacteria bacterium]
MKFIETIKDYFSARTAYQIALGKLVIAGYEIRGYQDVSEEEFRSYKSRKQKRDHCIHVVNYIEDKDDGEYRWFESHELFCYCENFEGKKLCKDKECPGHKNYRRHHRCYNNYIKAEKHMKECWKAIFTRNPKK